MIFHPNSWFPSRPWKDSRRDSFVVIALLAYGWVMAILGWLLGPHLPPFFVLMSAITVLAGFLLVGAAAYRYATAYPTHKQVADRMSR